VGGQGWGPTARRRKWSKASAGGTRPGRPPGRFHPTRAGGREGVNGPLRPGAWQEGATAPGSGLDRRGQRVGPVSRGQLPEAGPPTLTTPLTALIQAILQPGDAHSLRWVFVSDDGSPPSDSSHTVVQTRHDPQRPWRIRAWRRLVDASPALLSI